MSSRKGTSSAKPGKVRRLSVISRLHANVLRLDPVQGTWVFGMLWFNEDVGFDTIKQLASERLLEIPRFRSYLKLKHGKEHFIELDRKDIDMDYHVVRVEESLSPDQVYDQYISHIYSHFDFDFARPLWRFVYFTNVEGKHMLMVTVHHCVGDGISIVEVLYKLMDKESQEKKGAHAIVHVADPEELEKIENELEDPADDEEEEEEEDVAHDEKKKTPTTPLAPVPIQDSPAPRTRPPAKRSKPKNGFGPLNRVRIFAAGLLSPITSTFGSPDTPSPLMRKDVLKPSVVKSTAFTDQIPLEKIKQVKDRYPGSTINDILVSLLTMTLRGYLEELVNGDDAALSKSAKRVLQGKGKIRSSFPINARKPGADPFRDGSPCNRIALGELQFNFGYKSATELVWKTKRTLDRVKLSPTPFVQQRMANTLIRILPKQSSVDLFQKIGAQTTAMLSNVAGPQNAVYIAGHKVEDLSFALYGGAGLYTGLLSYDGKVSACICMDASLGDSKNVAKHWKIQFEKLYEETVACGDKVPKPFHCTSFLDKL